MTSTANLSQAKFNKLCASGRASGPASDQIISRAEAELGVKFPDEYVDFLRRFGAVLVSGIELYGLPNSPPNELPLWTDVTLTTRQLRRAKQFGTEDPVFVPFADKVGTEVYFYLNTQASPRTEIWAIGRGVRKHIPGTLHEFVLELAEGRISL